MTTEARIPGDCQNNFADVTEQGQIRFMGEIQKGERAIGGQPPLVGSGLPFGLSARVSAAESMIDPDEEDDRMSQVSCATSNVSTVSKSTKDHARQLKFGTRVGTDSDYAKTRIIVTKFWKCQDKWEADWKNQSQAGRTKD